ncbi:hypothetical protein [uncultured Rubinisphaera sp.]|uniref:hypothetical protein n=1 Tax=uncultured Rubinisphaera sp. TaxID=1678686 RepID=UPI0030D74BF5
MNYSLLTALLVCLLAGCGASQSDLPESSKRPVNQSVVPDDSEGTEKQSAETEPPTVSSAVEVIAISDDSVAVFEAEEYIRKQGVSALPDLAEHMADKRIPPAKTPSLYQKTKNVSHTPELGDYCFWMFQEIALDSIFARVNDEFSPFTKSTAKDWIAKRRELSRSEVRRDAAHGILQSLEEYLAIHPDDAEAEEIQSFYKKQLVTLNAVIAAEQKNNGVTKP